jgi:amicyanin
MKLEMTRSGPGCLRAAGAAFILGVCVAAGFAGAATDATVKIDNFTFVPEKLTIKAGTTVTWTNEDDIPHRVASATKAFKSKTLDSDDSYSFTFTTPGTYEYFCSLHPHMTRTVVVEPAEGSPKSSP